MPPKGKVQEAKDAVKDWAFSSDGSPAEERAKFAALDKHVDTLEQAKAAGEL